MAINKPQDLLGFLGLLRAHLEVNHSGGNYQAVLKSLFEDLGGEPQVSNGNAGIAALYLVTLIEQRFPRT